MLQVADEGAKDAGRLLANLALGLVPRDVVEAHARCELLPSSKPGGTGLRPLQLGSICRRIAMGGLVKYVAAAAQAAVGQDQLALGAADGCAKAYQALRTKCKQQPHRVVLSEDCIAAHQHLNRDYAATQLAKHCPKLLQPFVTWYGRESTHIWMTAAGEAIEVTSERGLDQGDPLANPVFAVSLTDPAQELKTCLGASDQEIAIIQMSDDIQICTVPGVLRQAASDLRRLWAPAGLTFGNAKQQTWSLSACPLPEPFEACRVQKLRCLGNTLEQMADETEPTLPQIGAEAGGEDLRRAAEKVSAIAEMIARVIEHGLPRQLGQNLFRYAAAGQTQHIMSARRLSPTAALAYDACLRSAWATVLDMPLTDAAWTRGNLPLREGGYAFGAIEHRAPAAFVACWPRTWSYVCRHLGLSSAAELLQADLVLAEESRTSAAAVRSVLPEVFGIPWEHAEPPSKPIKQKTLMVNYFACARKTLLASMGEHDATILRSCGGPGAGGFLTQQLDPSVLMDDDRFKVATARRLGGGLRLCNGRSLQCQHVGRNGGCQHQLDALGKHGGTCAVGGFVIERHDRGVRWLHKWLSQGRTSTPPQMEQVMPSENGRLDITFVQDGMPRWVDFAATSAPSTCPRSLAARAKADGRAARDEEQVKRSQYHNGAQPFVLEAHGRAGPSARTFIRAFSADASNGASESAAEAWASLSSVVQSGTAWIEMTAYGKNALSRGLAEIWIP